MSHPIIVDDIIKFLFYAKVYCDGCNELIVCRGFKEFEYSTFKCPYCGSKVGPVKNSMIWH